MKKKKIKVKIIIIVLIIILLLGVIVFLLSNRKESFKESITINIGDKIPKSNDYFTKDIKVKIKWASIDNYKVNTYKGTMSYKNKDYNIKLIVKDVNPPKIEGVKDITITVGDKVDFYKDIKISDDSKDELDKKVEGKYNLKKPNTYKLKYIVKDKSNTTTKDFKLIVKKKEEVKKEKTTNNTTSSSNKTSSKGYKVEKRNGLYYVNGILIANKTYPLPSNYNPGGLLEVFTTNFNKMKNDAKRDGINLWIRSGFRSYSYQQTLYNNYAARDGKAAADTYSARPGHSEHQTGLAADINSLDQSFANTKEGKWLNNNCYKYGFIIRYTRNGQGETGYIFEPWHIRYLGTDLAKTLYNNGNWITLENYLGITSRY
ncbi:MAG: D-alanyl-D-alanine carboxypeptidase family protein [Bacilli bacterium]|nr:D-alanyl-D-alanine carboxypeptidase family protein [Bacilli bacterium]